MILRTVIDSTQQPEVRKLLVRPTGVGAYGLAASDKCCDECNQCADCRQCPVPEINVDYTISYGGVSISSLFTLGQIPTEFVVKDIDFAPFDGDLLQINSLRFYASAFVRCYGDTFLNTSRRSLVGKHVVHVQVDTACRIGAGALAGRYTNITSSPVGSHYAFFPMFFSSCGPSDFCKARKAELWCVWDYQTFTPPPPPAEQNRRECWPAAPGEHVYINGFSPTLPQQLSEFVAETALQQFVGFGLPVITMIDNPLP